MKIDRIQVKIRIDLDETDCERLNRIKLKRCFVTLSSI